MCNTSLTTMTCLSFCQACRGDLFSLFCTRQSFLWESKHGTGADVKGFGICWPFLMWKLIPLLFCYWFTPLGICLFKIPLENKDRSKNYYAELQSEDYEVIFYNAYMRDIVPYLLNHPCSYSFI